MKSFTTTTLTLLTAAAAGLASAQSQAPVAGLAQIDSFSAACISGSDQCRYMFNIDSTPGHQNSDCAANQQTFLQDGVKHLPDVAQGECSGNQAWTWSVSRGKDNTLFFEAWYDQDGTGSNATYCYTSSPEDVLVQDNGADMTEYYHGPVAFTLSTLLCPGIATPGQ